MTPEIRKNGLRDALVAALRSEEPQCVPFDPIETYFTREADARVAIRAALAALDEVKHG